MSQSNRDFAWLCGSVVAVALLGWGWPLMVEYLNSVCATWRYVAMILGAAGVVFFLSYQSGTKAGAEVAETLVPLLVLAAFVVGAAGAWYSANADMLPAAIKRAL